MVPKSNDEAGGYEFERQGDDPVERVVPSDGKSNGRVEKAGVVCCKGSGSGERAGKFGQGKDDCENVKAYQAKADEEETGPTRRQRRA